MNASEKLQTPVILERTYEGTPSELWDLWTTKEGFEAWWGPVGFRVEVQEIDPRVGGSLRYLMIAADPEHVAAMKAMGQPIAHGTTGTFTVVEPHSRLTLKHRIDFIAGVEPYEHHMTVFFVAEASFTKMTIHIDPYNSAEWTTRAIQGMESQLARLPAALLTRRTA